MHLLLILISNCAFVNAICAYAHLFIEMLHKKHVIFVIIFFDLFVFLYVLYNSFLPICNFLLFFWLFIVDKCDLQICFLNCYINFYI